MNNEFSGRTVVVTGAASGIGNAVAHHFADRGAQVFGVDLSESVHAEIAQLSGTGHQAIVQDLTAPGACAEVVDSIVETAGQVDILVNSAGIALLDKALEVTDQRWDKTLALNLTASFKMAQAAGQHMTQAGYGRIINLASQASVIGLDRHVAYSASKAGLLGMTKVLSMEWAGAGVTVNVVSPTVVETPLGRDAWAGEKGEAMKKQIPIGRFAQPEEVAGLIAYLAGENAGMITGENILIDGGYSSI